MGFVNALVEILGTVFTEYVPDLAGAVVDMFSGLFWVTADGGGSLTIFGQALLAIVAFALVSSIFRIVYNIFKGRMHKRV